MLKYNKYEIVVLKFGIETETFVTMGDIYTFVAHCRQRYEVALVGSAVNLIMQ